MDGNRRILLSFEGGAAQTSAARQFEEGGLTIPFGKRKVNGVESERATIIHRVERVSGE
jgi:hypothetical protein